jgi:hypothetical protein
MVDTNDNNFIIQGEDEDFETNIDDLIAFQSDLSKNATVKKHEVDKIPLFDESEYHEVKNKEKKKK